MTIYFVIFLRCGRLNGARRGTCLRCEKTRRSVRVCAVYRPPGSTLGYRQKYINSKARFALKLNAYSRGKTEEPPISPLNPSALKARCYSVL